MSPAEALSLLPSMLHLALHAFLAHLGWAVEALQGLGEATCLMHNRQTEELLAATSKAAGLPIIQIKVAIALLSAFPFALVFKSLRGRTSRHVFSAISGICLIQLVYGKDWIHSLVSSMFAYLLMVVLPPTAHPGVVFVFAMSYLVLAHINNMRVSYLVNAFDFSRTQMMLTIKITAFSFNFARAQIERAKTPSSSLHSGPTYNLLEFLGFMYCFSGTLIGPSFEFMCYHRAVTGNAFVDPKLSSNGKSPSSSSHNRATHALYAVGKGLVWLLVYITVSKQFPLSRIGDAEFISSHGVWYRWWYAVASLFSERAKFYFGWKVAEGGCILAGLGEDGSDGSPFADVRNVDVLSYETSSCTSQLVRYWNRSTQAWLQRYTYEVSRKNMFLTYLVSALWHGLYPGFFLFFFSFALASAAERQVRRTLNPLLLDSNYNPRLTVWAQWSDLSVICRLYIAMCTVFTAIYVNYVTMIFNGLSWDNCVSVWGSFGYFGHVGLLVLIVVLATLPGKKKPKTA